MPWTWWVFFFFSSRRRHTRSKRDWSSDVCSSDLEIKPEERDDRPCAQKQKHHAADEADPGDHAHDHEKARAAQRAVRRQQRRKQCGLSFRSLGGVALAHWSIIPG